MSPLTDDTLRIPALDGFELAATLYEPERERENGAAVLVSSATAVRRGYYDGFARHLADQGFSVLTYDYRGIGGSRPRSLVGFKARMRQWGQQDLAGILEWIAGHLRPRKLLVVGHSVGGQIVGLAENNERIDGLLAVAAQSGYWGHWPSPARWDIALRWFVLVPLLTRLYGYLPGKFGTKEDLPGGVAREWARWGRRSDYLFEEALRAGFERFRKPILAYSFADDPYAPRAAVEGLLDFYSEADVTHRHIFPADISVDEIGHFGFFRDRFQETLWKDAAAWLKKTSAPGVETPGWRVSLLRGEKAAMGVARTGETAQSGVSTPGVRTRSAAV